MRGLIIKDFYCLKQNIKGLLAVLIIWGIIFLPQKESTLGLISMIMLMGVMQIASIATYDKQTQWDTCALSMPFTRANMVQEKYLMTLLLLIISAALSTAIASIAWVIQSGGLSGEWAAETAAALSMGTGLALIYSCAFLPLSMWLGVEKARYIPAALFLLVFMVIIFITKTSSLWNIQKSTVLSFCAWTLFLSVVLFVISFVVSLSIYGKKDF